MSNSAGKGCFITQTSGFIFIFLAVVLTVGVALIVHFTSTKSGATHCNCIYPASTSGLDKQREGSQIQFCDSLGQKVKQCKDILYKIHLS